MKIFSNIVPDSPPPIHMRYFTFKKLVRDKIVDHMKTEGQRPLGVKVLDDKRFVRELVKKLVEESSEMLKAKDIKSLKEELSDVVEIVNYLKSTLKLSEKQLKDLLKKKKDKNGGFSKRLYLEKVGSTDDNKWTKYYLDNPDKYPEIKKI